MLVLGNPTRGCRYCGVVERRESRGGGAVIYLPGRTCCPPGILDQITRHEEGRDLLEGQLNDRMAGIADLYEELEYEDSAKQDALLKRVLRADKNMKTIRARIETEMAAFTAEIETLYERLKTMEAA